MITYLKLGGILALAAALIAGGFHFGGLGPKADLAAYKTAVERQHAAQLAAVAKAYEDQVLAAQADHAAQQKVIDAYDAAKDAPDPVTTGLAHRVYIAAAAASGAECGQLPPARAVASRTQASGAIPGGNPSIIGRIQDVLDACTADADQLNAMVKLAP
jgi:hypothetical protein